MEMAERIKERRKAMGYTQTELGEKLDLKASAIAKYENGRVENIKRSTIADMAKVLECSPAYLMGWDEEDSTIQKRDANLENIEKILSNDGYTLCCESYDDNYFYIKDSSGKIISGLYDYELLPRYDYLKKKGTITAKSLLSSSFSLYPKEQEHIKKYRELDLHGKKMVDFTLQEEWERMTAESKVIPMTVQENATYYVNAAHADDYTNAPEELKQLEENIMDDENF